MSGARASGVFAGPGLTGGGMGSLRTIEAKRTLPPREGGPDAPPVAPLPGKAGELHQDVGRDVNLDPDGNPDPDLGALSNADLYQLARHYHARSWDERATKEEADQWKCRERAVASTINRRLRLS